MLGLAPPLRADFCSMTRFHALPLCHTLLWKMENLETYDMENAPPRNIILLPVSPTKGDREIEGILARTGKAGKWNPPPPSQYPQSKCFCYSFNLIMQNTL